MAQKQESETSYVLPVKNTDSNASVKERLTENTYQRILPARYLLKDENGDVKETPEELFERVAENVAQPEKENEHTNYETKKQEFEDLMKQLKFMPNSPTLMNAGTEIQQLSACISGDTPVYTQSGIKKMEEVEQGDKVLTHKGRFKEVKDIWSNGVKETVDLTFGNSNRSQERYSLTATTDHEIYTENGEWVEAGEVENPVKPQMWQTSTPFPKQFALSDFTTKKQKQVVSQEGKVKLKNAEDDRTPKFDQKNNQPNDIIENDEEMAYLFGTYLANGDIDDQALRITFNDEDEDISRIKKSLENKFGLEVGVEDSNSGNWSTLKVQSEFVTQLFEHHFNSGVTEKQLPLWIANADSDYQENLLEGIQKDGRGDGSLKLANPTLVYQTTLLARELGFNANFIPNTENKKSKNPTATTRIGDSNRIDNFQRKEGEKVEVFDMEVEDDHSFVAGDFVVHNCFVVEPEDSMEDIFQKVKDASLIFKSGGGMGYPFHKLRPKGAYIQSTGGVSSGPMSFMEVFDTMCGSIKQGGKRRGAQMSIMRVNHPDILRFIVSKRREGDFSNFNISVGLTEDFMEAVKNDEEYALTNPQTGEPFEISEKTAEFYNTDEEWNPEAEGSDSGKDDNFWRDFAHTFGDEVQEYDIELEPGEEMKLPARFIWETLIDGAWRNGEPGLYMYDESNKQHSFDVEKYPEKRIEASNPCVARGTLVNTPEGYRRVEEIEEGDRISTVFGSEPVEEIEVNEDYPIYKVEFSDGGVQYVTEGHRYHIKEKGSSSKKVVKKRLDEVEEGNYVQVHGSEWGKEGSQRDYKHGLKKGIVLGDESYSEKTVEQDSVAISSSKDRQEYNENLRELFGGEDNFRKAGESEGKAVTMPFTTEAQQQLVQELEVEPSKSPQRNFDITQVQNKQEAIGILDGLLLTDGRINLSSNHPIAEWTTTSPELAQNIRRLLLSLGCHGRIPDYKTTGKGEINGREIERNHPKMTVNISGDSLGKYLDQTNAGDYDPDFAEDIHEIRTEWMTTGNTWKAKIQSIEKVGTETTYDLYCEDSDTWITDGYVQLGCGEQPLMNYEACNLGHINLSLMVQEQEDGHALNWDEFKESNSSYDYENNLEEAVQDFLVHALDMEEFERTARIGTRFLDNVVTQSEFPLDKIEETVDSHRKIGLGLMGYAQMLIQLGVEYGSDVSIEIAKEIQRLITRWSVEESHELVKEKGEFSEWEKSKWADPTEYAEWFEKYSGGLNPENFEDGLKLRNHNTTTIAPTGTTSMIGDTSGGCEPIFSLAYFKNVAKDIQGEDMLVEFDDYFIRTLEANDVDVEEVKDEAEQLMRDNNWEGVNSISDEKLPPRVKEIFKTADTVTPEEHIDTQGAFQEYNHSGISKTCNFPNSATKEDVREAYMRAYDKGIKGMTVYRDGTRDVQVMTTREDNKIEDMEAEDLKAEIEDQFGGIQDFIEEAGIKIEHEENGFKTRDRPKTLTGVTEEIETPYGDMFVTVNVDEDGKPFEVFSRIGKAGGYTQSFTEALSRSISASLRAGIDPQEVVDQLEGIRSPQVGWDKGEQVLSVPDGMAKALERAMNGNNPVKDQSITQQNVEYDTGKDTEAGTVEQVVQSGENPECSECGSILELSEGCMTCPNCGYSKCG